MDNITIIARKFDLTDAIKDKIHIDFGAINKFNLNIVKLKVTLNIENAKQKRNVVEVQVNVAHNETIIIKQVDKDIYKALDLILERLEYKLSKIHDKLVDHKVVPIEYEQAEDVEPGDIQIVQEDMTIYKPLEIEDAVAILNAKNERLFLVFNDHNGEKRIIYKRKDNKIGLY